MFTEKAMKINRRGKRKIIQAITNVDIKIYCLNIERVATTYQRFHD